jgi:glycosyltransferase involved in cell wall biosynthesis
VIAGLFSPLPPAPTGVAGYSASLLRAMRRHGKVAVNGAGPPLYHLGNNHLHREIYNRALRHPGLVVLHDAVLHHFLLGTLKEQDYVAEFAYNYGEWSAALARDLWNRRARSAGDPEYFRYPMLRRIAETSTGVVVHNPAAARMVREHAPKARIFEIPHLFDSPPEPAGAEVARLRERLGITPSATLFAVLGHLRESKRLGSVLRAFEAVRLDGRASLLIAGDVVSSDYERSIAPLLQSPGVIRLPALPEREWWLHAHAVDVCINLRYPPAGETSGIAVRMMGIGKPVIVTAGNDMPGCVPVDRGPAESGMLAEMMRWLARFPDDALSLGDAARRHIRERHDPDRVARLYWNAIEECTGA